MSFWQQMILERIAAAVRLAGSVAAEDEALARILELPDPDLVQSAQTRFKLGFPVREAFKELLLDSYPGSPVMLERIQSLRICIAGALLWAEKLSDLLYEPSAEDALEAVATAICFENSYQMLEMAQDFGAAEWFGGKTPDLVRQALEFNHRQAERARGDRNKVVTPLLRQLARRRNAGDGSWADPRELWPAFIGELENQGRKPRESDQPNLTQRLISYEDDEGERQSYTYTTFKARISKIRQTFSLVT